MKRPGMPARKKRLGSRSPIKQGGTIRPNAKRAKKRLERTHGPKARREWTRTLPCAACGIVGYSVAAHVLGNGGMSRKKDVNTTAPLCETRFTHFPSAQIGCHWLFDNRRAEFDARFPRFNPERAAADCEAEWQNVAAHLSHHGADHE